mmetsp:Transcript_32432/g.66430  ORF Transcript_32432/g.66430 Transcript_32432/m.66430 type:complete len:96 (-) Transcript_32432:750-1037(-)
MNKEIRRLKIMILFCGRMYRFFTGLLFLSTKKYSSPGKVNKVPICLVPSQRKTIFSVALIHQYLKSPVVFLIWMHRLYWSIDIATCRQNYQICST